MSRVAWHKVRGALRTEYAVPEAEARELFWERFARRAERLEDSPQTANAPARAQPRPRTMPIGWRFVTGIAACGLVLWIAASLTQVRQTALPSGPVPLSTVEEVDVYIDYDSLMIMEDAENGGTVVLVAGATTNRAPSRNP